MAGQKVGSCNCEEGEPLRSSKTEQQQQQQQPAMTQVTKG